MLRKHLDYVNSKHYTDTDYQNYIKGENSNTCYSCHAAENQYEAIFKKIPDNMDSFRVYAEDHAHRRPPLRQANEDLLTSVDCLSCHYDGKRVVTNFEFKASDQSASPPYCNPKGSKLFSNSNNCLNCHYDEYKGTVKIAGVKSTDCLSCHQQYDQNKGTHYIYWRHDDSTHLKPENMRVMKDITAAYDASKKAVIIKWGNTVMPHPLSLFIEMVAFLEVSDQNGKVWAKSQMRLNRRDEYNLNVESRGYKAFRGISGHSLPLDGTAIYDTIANIKAPQGTKLQLKITGGEKGQYWLPDSTMVTFYHKVINL
jgi:hypothetical protein